MQLQLQYATPFFQRVLSGGVSRHLTRKYQKMWRNVATPDAVNEIIAKLDHCEDTIQRLDVLHAVTSLTGPDGYILGERCGTCYQVWPCATRRILDEAPYPENF